MKKRYIVILIISALLFAFNIIAAHYIRCTEASNMFTAISGWVSGIATAVIGIIAFRQGKKYDEESKKQNILNNLKNARQEMEKYMENYLLTTSIIYFFDNICKERQYLKEIKTMSVLSEPIRNSNPFDFFNKISFFIRKLTLDTYFIEHKKELIFSMIDTYEYILKKVFETYTIKKEFSDYDMIPAIFDGYNIERKLFDEFCSFSKSAEKFIRKLQDMKYKEIKEEISKNENANKEFVNRHKEKIEKYSTIKAFELE